MAAELKVKVFGLSGKMQLTGSVRGQHEVSIDYSPPLGDGNGFTSLELLMTSLCSCSGHTLLYLLSKQGKRVENIEIEATGQRRMETHPTVLTTIELHYRFFSKDLNEEMVEKAISEAEEKLCPVWAMLKGSTKITWNYEIVQ
jgi:putative redox protein